MVITMPMTMKMIGSNTEKKIEELLIVVLNFLMKMCLI